MEGLLATYHTDSPDILYAVREAMKTLSEERGTPIHAERLAQGAKHAPLTIGLHEAYAEAYRRAEDAWRDDHSALSIGVQIGLARPLPRLPETQRGIVAVYIKEAAGGRRGWGSFPVHGAAYTRGLNDPRKPLCATDADVVSTATGGAQTNRSRLIEIVTGAALHGTADGYRVP